MILKKRETVLCNKLENEKFVSKAVLIKKIRKSTKEKTSL